MSTRATVWIRNEKEDISVFLYHHCDGYSLDEDIDPVLKNLSDEKWNVVDIRSAIEELEGGDVYKEKDRVGWDSEYVYKISIDERKMYKYDTGIGDPFDEAGFESRLTDLEKTYEYPKKKKRRSVFEENEEFRKFVEELNENPVVEEFEPETPEQITRKEDIAELQERLVQTCIDFINEKGLTDIYMVRFNADDLNTSAKEGKWTSATDSWIGVEGLRYRKYKRKNGETFKMTERYEIGERC